MNNGTLKRACNNYTHILIFSLDTPFKLHLGIMNILIMPTVLVNQKVTKNLCRKKQSLNLCFNIMYLSQKSHLPNRITSTINIYLQELYKTTHADIQVLSIMHNDIIGLCSKE